MSQTLRRINLVLLAIVILQGIGFLWAQEVAAQAPAPFIYRPYYGNFPGWTATFDHKYADYGSNGTFVRFTGEEQSPLCDPYGHNNFCYDGHAGYDLS